MKKILLLVSILFTFANFASAQKRFEIRIDSAWVIGSTKLPDTVQCKDSIKVGLKMTNLGTYQGMNGTARNPYGQDSFSGGKEAFNVNVEKYSDFPLLKAPKNSINITLPGAPYLGVFTCSTGYIKIDPILYTPDSFNIIIIWPSNGRTLGLKDSLDTIAVSNKSPVAPLKVYEEKCASGVETVGKAFSFKIYPNPVRDNISIEMISAGKGTIFLTDISGKQLATQAFEARAGERINMPLADIGELADGVYFIAIETSSGRETSKILIQK